MNAGQTVHNWAATLREQLPESWPWVMASLRQDRLVWEALESSDLGGRVLQREGEPVVQDWAPAALALLDLGLGLRADEVINEVDSPQVVEISASSYDWHNSPTTLAYAGRLALVWLARYHSGLSWEQVLADARTAGELNLTLSETALACLYGMAAQKNDLLAALASPGGPARPELAVHIVLSTHASPDEQARLLADYLAGLSLQQGLELLYTLARSRPALAAGLAQGALERVGQALGCLADGIVAGSAAAGQCADLPGIHNPFAHLECLVQAAHYIDLAGQPEKAVPLLAETVRKLRQARGRLAAQLAQVVERTGDGGNFKQGPALEAWKQAVQLSPAEPLYQAGLVNRLLDMSLLEEAASYLQKGQESAPHAALRLAGARLAQLQGNMAGAQVAAEGALNLAQTGQALTRQEFAALAGLFWELQMIPQVLQATQLAGQLYPLDWYLLALLARSFFALDVPEAALSHALAALAAASDSADLPDGWQLEMRRLVAGCLEKLGDWESALVERQALVESASIPFIDDSCALLRCAWQTERYSMVLQIGQDVLQSLPDDLEANTLTGQAALSLQDFPQAVLYLRRATQLAPERPDLWLALTQALYGAGQDDLALETLCSASQAAPGSPEIHLAVGEAYLKRNALTQALPALRQAAALDPGNPRVALSLGQTLFLLGYAEEARQVLQPVYDATRSQLGTQAALEALPVQELSYLYARALLETGDIHNALPILKALAGQRPGDPGPSLDLAQAVMQLNAQPAAAQFAALLLERLLELNEVQVESLVDRPAWRAQALALLAEALSAAGDAEGAMRTYRRALEMPYNRQPAQQERLALGLGMAALRLDQPEMALAALQEAAHLEPNNLQVQRALADAYLTSGLIEDASSIARAVLEQNPGDSQTLNWFVKIGRQLQVQPGPAGNGIARDVTRAMEQLTQLEPERGDLLLELAGRRLAEGDFPAALQSYQRLDVLDADPALTPPQALLAAARAVRSSQSGETGLTIRLLHRAVDCSLAAPAQVNESDPDFSLADLYHELALSYQQVGNLEAALRAYDQALALDASRVDIYRGMAELLYQMDRHEAALESLESALRLTPQDAGLRYRLAEIHHLAGNLPQAVLHACQSAADLPDACDANLAAQVHLLAAELSYQALLPGQARSYLGTTASAADPALSSAAAAQPPRFALDDFRRSSLGAELALDAGDEPAAAQAVAAMRRLEPQHPRCLAARARLAFLRGEFAAGVDLFQSALQALDAGETGGWNGADEITLNLASVCQAAVEANQWGEAFSLAQRLVERASNFPLAQMKLGQVLLLRAETQVTCQDLEMRQHALGGDALADTSRQACDDAFQEAANLLDDIQTTDAGLAPVTPDGENRRIIAVWQARQRCLFVPAAHYAQALQKALTTYLPRPDFVAALVMAFRRCGDARGAAMAGQLDWLPGYRGPGVMGHPLVLTQLALALADINPMQAVEVAQDVLERLPVVDRGAWPQAPMLHFLLARQSYRAGEYAAAFNAIESALAAWPDEARWHALAAQICLSRDPAAGLPDRSRALQHLERAASLEPENILHHLTLGSIYSESGDVARAVQALGQASLLDPEQAEIWLALAQAQQVAGDWENAAISAGQAAEKLSDPTPALLLQGQAALHNHNPRLALNRAQTLLQARPDHADGLYLLARAYEALDRPADALDALERALAFFQNSQPGVLYPLQLERIHLLRRVGGPSQALSAVQELAAANPNQPEILFLVAQWAYESKQPETALQAAQAALQAGGEVLSPAQRGELHFRIGLDARQNGQLDQAIHHLSESIELMPEDLEAYLALGRAYQERREYRQALKVYQRAIGVAGGDYRPYYFAGVVLKDSKDYLAAEAMLRRATQLAPNEVSVHRLLGAVVALNLVHNRRLSPGD